MPELKSSCFLFRYKRNGRIQIQEERAKRERKKKEDEANRVIGEKILVCRAPGERKLQGKSASLSIKNAV